MILYVLYEDFLDGDCSYPKAVVDDLSIAEKWKKKSEGNDYMELELNNMSGLKPMRTHSSGGNIDIKKVMKIYIEMELSRPTSNKRIFNVNF